jgi:hypothetical protein
VFSNPHLDIPWRLYPVILKAHIDNVLNILLGKFVSDPGFIHLLHFLFLFNDLIFIFWINVIKDHPGFECDGFYDVFETINQQAPGKHELSRELLFEASTFILQSLDKNSNPLLCPMRQVISFLNK